METNPPLRKACDLCYRRKLKCDGQKPRCSNCITYGTDCTQNAPSRKSKPRPRRRGGLGKGASEKNEIRNEQRVQAQPNKFDSENAEDAEDHDHTSGAMTLPPLQQTMDMLGIFLNTFNAVLPLFHPDTLLRQVGECYALPPRQRDPVAWAAINVVLALASQQHSDGGDSNGHGWRRHTQQRPDRASSYLKNAQSVVSTVMLGETRLLNVQTLVGIALLLQTERDQTHALVLIAATMRLAHKIGLHSRAASAHLDPVQRRQHARVFWLAYILDKDLSLRMKQPSVQRDDDIDLALPSCEDVEAGTADRDAAAGRVATADESVSMNYFQARVQLANIQGGVYDSLYSTRALNMTVEQRAASRDRILDALGQWRASIPPAFGARSVVSMTRNNPANAGFFCALHGTSLGCMTQIHRANAWDEQWVNGLSRQLQLRHRDVATQTRQLPQDWDTMVGEARDFMILFREVWSSEVWFRWLVPCPYTSAMVLLTVHNLQDALGPDAHLDGELIDEALLWMDEAIKEMPSEEIYRLRNVCGEAIQAIKWLRAKSVAGSFRGNLLADLGIDTELP